MIVTVTQYDRLTSDAQGNLLPIAPYRSSEARTTAGAFAAIAAGNRIARVATDTAVKLTDAAGNVLFFPASTAEFIGVNGGEVFTLATV